MRKFITNIVAAAMLIIPSVAAASDMRTVANATFKLYEGSDGMCSTTFLHNSNEGALFLTAAHCVEGKNLNVRRQLVDPKDMKTVLSETVWYVKPVKTTKKKDIAVLQTLDKNVFFAEDQVDIATVEEANSLEIGDAVMASGFPQAGAKAITKGEFTGKVPALFDWEAPVYQSTVTVAPGNSGGAMYAKFGEEWKLIGTTSAIRRDTSIMNYFQTIETVQEALKGFMNKAPEVPAPSMDTGSVDER